MEPQSRTFSTSDALNTDSFPFPATTKPSFIPRGLGKAYRRIGAKLRHTQSMQQLAAMPLNTHPGARALGSHHGPRPDSPASTLSGSSPTSQGKASMDAERNARPFPNGFIQPPAPSDVVLTVPNRRTASIPFSLPSQRTMAKPVSSGIISTFDSHTSTPSSTRLDAYSSSSCAGAIAAHAAAADSTLQPPLKIQPPTTSSLSPILPTSNLFSCCQRSQHLASCGKTRDVSSLHVLSERLDAPLPPVERVLRHPICLTPGLPSLLPAAPQLSAANFLPAKFSIEGVSARLSPAIITRQPQHPILSLPPISPISSPTGDSRRLRSRSLRSVPALPMEGSEDLEPAEHDNAALDDLDEEEDGDEDAEEDPAEAEHPDTASEDGESASGPPSSETSHPRNLPVIDTSPLNLSFVVANTSGTIRRDDKTPKDSRMSDYFTSKLAEPASYSQLHSSRQFPASWTSARTTPVIPTTRHSPKVLAASRGISASRALPTPTTPIINLRPNMYHQASRSLCDMSEILKRPHHTPEVAAETPKSPIRSPVFKGDSLASETGELDTKLGPSLRRRLSMPTFGPSSAPPPYPHFRFGEHGPTIQPRDEEGSERLPHYTNDIYLRAIMPRKMEFSAPGVQARDRKWRRTLCVLEGTAFRVYKCPPTAARKGLIGNLWEKTVGVGDIAAPPTQTPTSSALAKERAQEREARQIKFAIADGTPAQSPTSPASPSIIMASPVSDEPEAQSSSSTRSRLLPTNFRRKNRNASDRSLTSLSETGARRSFSSPQQLAPDLSSGRAVSLPTSANRSTPRTPTESTSPAAGSPRALHSPRIKRRSLWVDDPAIPQPQEQDLVHAYALHSAESGLGSDYLKRRNVIRVRMEGQQFLLQAADVASVVDWIEAFQAAANIATDLDERPMPKGPLFPRRRRRRPQAQTNPSS